MVDRNLPAPKPPQSVGSKQHSQPLNVWSARADELRAALGDDPLTPTQIAGQLSALRAAGVGYWEDMTEAAWTAAIVVWREALSSVPAPFALEAFRYWGSTMSRRPAPGDIANRARRQIDAAMGRLKTEQPAEPSKVFDPYDITEEERQRRKEASERLQEMFPMLRRVPRAKPQDYDRTYRDIRTEPGDE